MSIENKIIDEDNEDEGEDDELQPKLILKLTIDENTAFCMITKEKYNNFDKLMKDTKYIVFKNNIKCNDKFVIKNFMMLIDDHNTIEYFLKHKIILNKKLYNHCIKYCKSYIDNPYIYKFIDGSLLSTNDKKMNNDISYIFGLLNSKLYNDIINYLNSQTITIDSYIEEYYKSLLFEKAFFLVKDIVDVEKNDLNKIKEILNLPYLNISNVKKRKIIPLYDYYSCENYKNNIQVIKSFLNIINFYIDTCMVFSNTEIIDKLVILYKAIGNSYTMNYLYINNLDRIKKLTTDIKLKHFVKMNFVKELFYRYHKVAKSSDKIKNLFINIDTLMEIIDPQSCIELHNQLITNNDDIFYLNDKMPKFEDSFDKRINNIETTMLHLNTIITGCTMLPIFNTANKSKYKFYLCGSTLMRSNYHSKTFNPDDIDIYVDVKTNAEMKEFFEKYFLKYFQHIDMYNIVPHDIPEVDGTLRYQLNSKDKSSEYKDIQIFSSRFPIDSLIFSFHSAPVMIYLDVNDTNNTNNIIKSTVSYMMSVITNTCYNMNFHYRNKKTHNCDIAYKLLNRDVAIVLNKENKNDFIEYHDEIVKYY